MNRLTGKTALVTGASRGIGRAIAIDLAREGARVAINYRSNDERARNVANELRQLGAEPLILKADISDAQAARQLVAEAAEKMGRLDALVNNAGITRDRSLRKMTDEDWTDVIEGNLNPVFYCISAAIPIMSQQNYGRIVNISSMNGQAPAFGQANYGASKGGIIAFTRTAALELARSNITVNVVAPGFTMTDMLAQVSEDIQESIKKRIPLGRFAQPEDIAKAVTFLLADGDYITGAQINVNGGAFM